jgi:hypothetical protein
VLFAKNQPGNFLQSLADPSVHHIAVDHRRSDIGMPHCLLLHSQLGVVHQNLSCPSARDIHHIPKMPEVPSQPRKNIGANEASL